MPVSPERAAQWIAHIRQQCRLKKITESQQQAATRERLASYERRYQQNGIV